jgi:predicted RecB family endonuclease
LQHKVKQVDARAWTDTNHDLDFLIVRDGVRYGVEVKNQLGYIDQTEFQIKLAMCVHFGIRPMFVTRAMPKNYIYAVMRSGGFSLLTDR